VTRDEGLETPLAPIPAEAPAPRKAPRAKRGRAPRRARDEASGDAPRSILRGAYGFAFRSWRVLLGILLVHLVLAFAVVMPLQMRVEARLGDHMHAPAMAGAPDAIDAGSAEFWREPGVAESVWRDVKRLEAGVFETRAVVLFWTSIVAWFFGALVSGGHLGGALYGAKPRFAIFLREGARHYGAMLRIGLVFALLVYLLARLVLDFWGAGITPSQEAAPDSGVAWWGERLRLAVLALGFLWLRVVADLARADLVVRERGSAWAAFFRAWGRTLRHPLASFGLALGIGVPMLALVLGLAWVHDLLGTSSTAMVLVGFGTVQLAVWLRLASRAAVLAGDVELVKRWGTVPPKEA